MTKKGETSKKYLACKSVCLVTNQHAERIAVVPNLGGLYVADVQRNISRRQNEAAA